MEQYAVDRTGQGIAQEIIPIWQVVAELHELGFNRQAVKTLLADGAFRIVEGAEYWLFE
jgi:hypothetical protein